MSRRRIICLLTDFGMRDPYVGAMKGVILDRCPAAEIVDITHELPPYATASAAYFIWSIRDFYPAGTVFITVVDPGVGSARRILMLRSAGQIFLAPDNGLLNYLPARAGEGWFRLRAGPERPVRQPVTARSPDQKTPGVWGTAIHSATFHGRDIFAPAGAALAGGASPEDMGEPLGVQPPKDLFVRLTPGVALNASVLHVDNFGNLITNVRCTSGQLRQLRLKTAAGKKVTSAVRTYSDAPTGSPVMLVGSTGLLEIAMNRSRADTHLGVQAGDELAVEPLGSGSMRGRGQGRGQHTRVAPRKANR